MIVPLSKDGLIRQSIGNSGKGLFIHPSSDGVSVDTFATSPEGTFFAENTSERMQSNGTESILQMGSPVMQNKKELLDRLSSQRKMTMRDYPDSSALANDDGPEC